MRKKLPSPFTKHFKSNQLSKDNTDKTYASPVNFITTKLISDRASAGLFRPLSAVLVLVLISLVLALFIWRLFDLQVIAGDRYAQLANGNRVREVVLHAERGLIFDRNGEVLAENTPAYQVRINPYQLEESESDRLHDYKVLSKFLNLDVEVIRFEAEQEGLDYVLPIAIGRQLDQTTALQLEALELDLKGVSVDIVPARQYNAKHALAHILGYTGLVNRQDLDSREELLLVDYVGRSGIEQQYDKILRGVNGFERYEVDAMGRPLRLLASKPAVPGKNIYLTIDVKAQASLAKNIQKQISEAKVTRGSGVAMHPVTGEVIALVSLPAYDNNLFARGITTKQYQGLLKNPDQPLFNKAIAGGYPSGSTIKPVVASAALQEKVVDEDTVIFDRGYIDLVNRYNPSQFHRFHGWRRSGLGAMNVRRAIAMSSNIYFYTIGGGYGNIDGLGVDRMSSYLRDFGFGSYTEIDLPGEGRGRVPDAAWKQEFKGEPWYQGDSFNLSIGQGDLLVSPLQLVVATSAVANGGQLLKPQLLHHIQDQEPGAVRVDHQVNVESKYLEIVREGMYEAIVNGAVCSCKFADVPVEMAGKTGTAETNTAADEPAHGWFTSFAPYKNPELATVVLIEKGDGGSSSAAPAVASFLADFFSVD